MGSELILKQALAAIVLFFTACLVIDVFLRGFGVKRRLTPWLSKKLWRGAKWLVKKTAQGLFYLLKQGANLLGRGIRALYRKARQPRRQQGGGS